MFKNVSSQKLYVRAFADAGHATLDPGEPVTGDAANITAKLSKDGAAASATNDTNPTEIEDGIYAFDLTQAETNADVLLPLPESSTAGVQVVAMPDVIYTRPPNFPALGIESDGDLTKVNTLDGHTAQTADHAANITSLVNRLGAWTGTGVNTVLGAFKALLSKGASAPSDIGGTFSPADDSVEALRDRGDAAWITAAGFSTHDDPDPLGYIDAAISSRQPSGAVDLNADQSGVTIGTVNALAAAAIKSIWDQATAALTTAGSIGKAILDHIATWTSTRAGYVDNLAVGGLVASQADVQGITQAQRVRIVLPATFERPDSGSTTYRLYIYAYDETHVAEDLDSNPTVTAENNATTGRSTNLGTVTKVPATTGIYYVDYTVADSHAIEGLLFKATVTEGGVETEYAAAALVVDTTAVDFTAADRAKLDTLHDTRIPGVIQPQTGDAYAKAVEVEGDTQDIQSRLPAALTGDGLMKADTLRVGGTLQTAGDLAALIAALNNLGAADVRTAVGLASANLDTQLATLATAAQVAALENVSAAQVESSCTAALVALHLDHLLGAAYDPASKPGVATALLNVLMEDDGGTPRFTANALEQAPAGGGGSGLAQTDAVAASPDAGTIGEAFRAVLNLARGKRTLVDNGDGTYTFSIFEFDDASTAWKTFTVDHPKTPSSVVPV